MRWLALVLVFGVLVGLVCVELGGFDGQPLAPEPPKHEAVQAAGRLQADRTEFFLVVERQLAEEAARLAEAARLEQERRDAARAAEEAKRRRAVEQRRTVTRTTQAHTAAPTAKPAPSGDVFYRLAMCETGGTMNQRATSRTGKFLGYFQFDRDSYVRAGGTGDPRDDSYAEQLRVAQNWQRLVGWGAWPHCSRKLGLR